MNQFPIETRELTKTFDSRTAVDRLSLQVQPGDVFGFLGQNGAGKSTTIRMLLGLVKPSSGQVFLLGHDVPKAHELAREVSFSPKRQGELTGVLRNQMSGHADFNQQSAPRNSNAFN